VVRRTVADALALRAGAERVVEREQERLRTLERFAAAAAAKVLAELPDGAADDLDRHLAPALAQRRLDRLDEARAVGRLEHDAIEDHRDRLAVAEIGGRAPRRAAGSPL